MDNSSAFRMDPDVPLIVPEVKAEDAKNHKVVFSSPNGLCLWCCGDQVRKGAATNAIQIAELLIEK